MPLLDDGTFECPACQSRHGYLPPDEPPVGDPADLLGEMICTDCPGADAAKTETSYTGKDGHRHSATSAADVATAKAFYAKRGTPWEKPKAAAKPAPQPAGAAGARPRPAPS